MLQKYVWRGRKSYKIAITIITKLHKIILTVMRSQFLSAKSFNYLSSVLDEVIEVCPLVAPNVSVAEAITLVCQGKTEQSHILNAVVVENSIPIGVLTSGDIVRQIAAGKKIEFVRVADALTQPLVTLMRSQIKSIDYILDKFDNQLDSLIVLSQNGDVEGIITKANIIPALKNTLLEQESSIGMMRRIIETVSDGVFIYDLEAGLLVEANSSACKMHGFTYEELLKACISKYIHQNSHYVLENFFKTLELGCESFIEATGLHKDGSAFDGEVRGTVVNYNYRKFAIIAVRDISNRRRLETALSKLGKINSELACATRMKDEFLANMGHELRTPLNAILGLSEGLIDEVYAPLVEKQKKAISNIQNCGQNLLDLINDILDLTKIESGDLKLDKSLVDINTLCNSICPFVKQLACKKNITLTFTIAPTIDKVWIDALRIRQVLINLLSNGIKFTANGGTVELVVNVDKEAKKIYFRVFDTGIGIDAKNFNKLFQPFVQIDASLSRSYSGTGLGLALVKKIIDMHGGNVTVSSEVGKGSCFTCTLPLITAPQLNYSDFTHQSTYQSIKSFILTEENSNYNSINKPLILVADDNITNAELICEFLTVCGYQFTIARDGLEAVEFAIEQNPQLIVIDVQMPKLDGLAAIGRMREVPDLSQTPIIALTALSEGKNKCIEAGADEFILKPVSLKYLNSVIQKLLTRNQKP
ncbi:hypothetical protein DSM106972_064050 [Dulcicalothrix desertica PCC 7102]|uniref:Circadian input-output histidine kinase CikA n=2 Tax=Dulcicalothrix desertica TaxID=32056 RepID=A0A433V6Q6_9CYAN|nr:hypothetical protein DSM106972_064050 [Dulcicalothrix desertica PCC 7102]TWH42934.1 PAS domain S-box-containing protein [Dulcicalothrix desertica PCC 7102]